MSGEQVRLHVPPKLYRVHSWITQVLMFEVVLDQLVNASSQHLHSTPTNSWSIVHCLAPPAVNKSEDDR